MDIKDRDLLIEVSTNQKNLFHLVQKFMDESNKRICKIEDVQNKDRESIINIRADIINLQKSEKDQGSRIKTLEDERNVNTAGIIKGSVPMVIKAGVITLIITTVVGAVSTFVMYQQTFQKLSTIIQPQQIHQQQEVKP